MPASWDGIISVLPAVSDASGDSPLAAASCSTVTPSLAATEDSDSPGATVWGNAADAAAGAASIVTAIEIRTLRRIAGSASGPCLATDRTPPETCKIACAATSWAAAPAADPDVPLATVIAGPRR